MAEERIQKIMAEQGLCSRRAAEQIIAEGRVKVNGHPVKVRLRGRGARSADVRCRDLGGDTRESAL